MDNIDTKTCKVCKDTKVLSSFKPRAAVCRVCTNEYTRKAYYEKQGITELPPKRKKYGSIEEKHQAVLVYNRTRDKYNSQNITDEYVKDILRTQASYKGVIPDLSMDNINKKRQDIKQSRSHIKYCIGCKKDLDKTLFYKGVKHLCKKCHYRKHYTIYGRSPHNPTNNERTKKRYALNKELLTTPYVKALIKSSLKNYKLRIRISDISDEHVELKRKELTLKKQIEHGNKSNHQENSTESH